jgi:uncharacterized membrane protein YhaH (DUF805 family)
MGFGEAISTCFGKYATFSGRACRSEYWFFILFLTLAQLVAAIVDLALGFRETGPLATLLSLAALLPWLAATCRRLHDVDRSGWWLFLWLIPVIGAIVIFVWNVMRGTRGPNRFGDDPLADVGAGLKPAPTGP